MMEILGSEGEVVKSFKIPHFLSYLASSEIHLQITINLDNFKSVWMITVFPMYSDKSSIDIPINCDVVILLKCIECNMPIPYLKEIQIMASVRGRENYPICLKQREASLWKEILIPRVVLQSLLSPSDDTFQFNLKFKICEILLKMSESSSDHLIENLGKLLANPEYCDTCIISVSGTKFLVHSAVLHSQSNLLTRKADSIQIEQNNDATTEMTKNFSGDNTIGTPSGSCIDLSSYNGSPCKRPPLFVVPGNESPRFKFSPVSKSAKESPLKKTRTQLTTYFPQCSLKDDLEVNESMSSSSTAEMKTSKPNSPFIESKFRNTTNAPPKSKENKTPSKSIKDYFSPCKQAEIIRSPCGSKPVDNFQNPKRKLCFDGHANNRLIMISVNMSTSVTQELILWLYTGKSSRLAELSRPLLVAALRYDVPSLARAAQLHLSSFLTFENAPELLVLGHSYEASILKENALHFCLAHANEITPLSSWAEMALKYPELALEFTRYLALKTF